MPFGAQVFIIVIEFNPLVSLPGDKNNSILAKAAPSIAINYCEYILSEMRGLVDTKVLALELWITENI